MLAEHIRQMCHKGIVKADKQQHVVGHAFNHRVSLFCGPEGLRPTAVIVMLQ